MNAQILEHPILSQKKQRAGLANALETTEEMLIMARAGKWDLVKDLEIRRRDYLDQCLTKPVDYEDIQLFSDALGMLLSLNERLVCCVQDTREEFDRQRQGTRQAIACAGKYLDV